MVARCSVASNVNVPPAGRYSIWNDPQAAHGSMSLGRYESRGIGKKRTRAPRTSVGPAVMFTIGTALSHCGMVSAGTSTAYGFLLGAYESERRSLMARLGGGGGGMMWPCGSITCFTGDTTQSLMFCESRCVRYGTAIGTIAVSVPFAARTGSPKT